MKYQIIGEYGLWQHYKSEGVVTEMLFEGLDDGYVRIDGVQSKIINGIATLDLGILNDGVYEPTLVLEDKVIHLEAIKKSGGTILPVKTSDSTVRRLLKRVNVLEDTVNTLVERLGAVEEKMRTDVLF